MKQFLSNCGDMERHIDTLCNFTLGFVTCPLLEDMVDVQVRIRTHGRTHTLKEDWEYCSLKVKTWENTPNLSKPFRRNYHDTSIDRTQMLQLPHSALRMIIILIWPHITNLREPIIR